MGSKVSINKPSFGISNDDKCAFIKLHCPSLVSVEEIIIKEEIADKYLNPATDFITINLQSSEGLNPSEGSVVEIYNSFGELVLKDVAHLQDVAHLKRIDVSHLPVGLYFVKIGNRVEKFVKM